MHASSFENMRLCYRKFIEGGPLETAGEAIVLDFGGADVNGSYRSLFRSPPFKYIAADLAPGEGVAVVLDDPYQLPFEDRSIDVVISGQALEHCEFFWLAFAEMARVLKPEGYIFLIAPSAGPIHQYPVDCYRFYPDAYRALAKYANCRLIDVWNDERGPWRDLVGVFRRQEARIPPPLDMAPPPVPPAANDFHSAPEEEVTRGKRFYRDILAELHDAVTPSLYLEIGVRHGHSLALAACPAIGVDPFPELAVELSAGKQVVALTSDDFFAGPHRQWLTRAPELVFVDGMHLFEFALRDFMNVERLARPDTLVVFDDIFPNHPIQGDRTRRTRVWTGDVWKLYHCLRKYRPGLFLLPVDAAPAGLLLVGGLDPGNRILWDNYNPIVRAYTVEDIDPPEEILARVGADCGASETFARIGAILRAARAEGLGCGPVVERLRAIPLLSGAASPPE